MEKKRKMALVVNKTTLVDTDELNLSQWAQVSFEEKWNSLERLRRTAYAFYNKPYPIRVERVLTIIR